MSDKQEKPVWRLNTGNGVPSDFFRSVILCDGGVMDWCQSFSSKEFAIIKGSLNIAAYETNRTRKAKYR